MSLRVATLSGPSHQEQLSRVESRSVAKETLKTLKPQHIRRENIYIEGAEALDRIVGGN